MIIFLYGSDTYRSRQKLNEIIEHHKKVHKSGLNLKFFEGESLNFQDFKDEIETISMFKEKKLMVLEGIFLNQKFKEEFLKEKEKIANSKNIILFYEKGEINENEQFFKFIKENSKSQEFKLLEGEKLKNWAKNEFENFGVKIDPKALEKLLEFVGNNLWQMTNEIKKLVSYKKPTVCSPHPHSIQEIKIEIEDIELLVKPKIETDIFKTIDAIATKNKKQALFLIHKHLEKGDTPLYLLSMINFQFRNLLTIKSCIEKNIPYYSILKMSKLHPFVVKKGWQQVNKFTFQELKKIYQKIFEVDLNVKTGRIDSQTALDLLIAEI